MSTETIELLKNYEPTKMQWPAMHQQKIDGVPTRIMRLGDKCIAYSRQGETFTSIPHILEFCSVFLQDGESVVMELHIQGKSFKEISGLVRRKAPCRELVGWVFDFVPLHCGSPMPGSQHSWETRMRAGAWRAIDLAATATCALSDLPVRFLPGVRCASAAEAEEAHAALMLANPDAEGSVLHSLQKTFQPGKRCWGTQRMKPVPTIDLLVIGFEEAISETGVPLKMVGRINAVFNSYKKAVPGKSHAGTTAETIGIGPGALTHTERKALWSLFKSGNFKPRIAEIRYMRDETYDALRQPTFKQWRDDKKEPERVLSLRS